MSSDESKNGFNTEKQSSTYTVGLGAFYRNLRHLFLNI
jgi:hypothetical protein